MPLRGRRARLLIVAATIAAVALGGAAFVWARDHRHSGPTSSAGSAFIGHWRGFDASVGADANVEIQPQGDHFVLRSIATTYLGIRMTLKGGRLVPIDPRSPVVQVRRTGDILIMSMPGGAPSGADVTMTLRRVTVPRSLSLQESTVVSGAQTLQVALMGWAVEHGTRFPSSDLVASGSPFAAYVKTWPTNPYTGGPMAQGTGPGEFTYAVRGSTYSMKAFGENGTTLCTITIP